MWDIMGQRTLSSENPVFQINRHCGASEWPDGAQWLVTTSNDSSGATWRASFWRKKAPNASGPLGKPRANMLTLLEKAMYSTRVSKKIHLVVLNGIAWQFTFQLY